VDRTEVEKIEKVTPCPRDAKKRSSRNNRSRSKTTLTQKPLLLIAKTKLMQTQPFSQTMLVQRPFSNPFAQKQPLFENSLR